MLKSGRKQVKFLLQSLEIFSVKSPLSEHTYQVTNFQIESGTPGSKGAVLPELAMLKMPHFGYRKISNYIQFPVDLNAN